jgi:hypothetical protein
MDGGSFIVFFKKFETCFECKLFIYLYVYCWILRKFDTIRDSLRKDTIRVSELKVMSSDSTNINKNEQALLSTQTIEHKINYCTSHTFFYINCIAIKMYVYCWILRKFDTIRDSLRKDTIRVSEGLFNANSAICRLCLYHDENKLIFNEMMRRPALY